MEVRVVMELHSLGNVPVRSLVPKAMFPSCDKADHSGGNVPVKALPNSHLLQRRHPGPVCWQSTAYAATTCGGSQHHQIGHSNEPGPFIRQGISQRCEHEPQEAGAASMVWLRMSLSRMYWGAGVGVTEGDGEVEGVMEDDIDIDAVTDGVVEALGVPEEVGDGEALALGVAVIEGEDVADGEGEGGGRLGQAGGIGGAPGRWVTAEASVHPQPTATHHQPCHPHKSK